MELINGRLHAHGHCQWIVNLYGEYIDHERPMGWIAEYCGEPLNNGGDYWPLYCEEHREERRRNNAIAWENARMIPGGDEEIEQENNFQGK